MMNAPGTRKAPMNCACGSPAELRNPLPRRWRVKCLEPLCPERGPWRTTKGLAKWAWNEMQRPAEREAHNE